MAVHSVSLRWLKENRRVRAENRPAQAEPDVDTKPSSREPEAAQPKPEAGESCGESEQEDDRGSDGVLGLSSSEFDDLLGRFGSQGGRALLALIFKLSSIESELTALRKAIEQAGPLKANEKRADHGNVPIEPAPVPPAQGEDQVGILDQVFRNNLTLWRRMD